MNSRSTRTTESEAIFKQQGLGVRAELHNNVKIVVLKQKGEIRTAALLLTKIHSHWRMQSRFQRMKKLLGIRLFFVIFDAIKIKTLVKLILYKFSCIPSIL